MAILPIKPVPLDEELDEEELDEDELDEDELDEDELDDDELEELVGGSKLAPPQPARATASKPDRPKVLKGAKKCFENAPLRPAVENRLILVVIESTPFLLWVKAQFGI